MNGTTLWFDDILVNNTALDAPYGKNWVQNTDGFDTMDVNNVRLTNFVYQGGDDAIAIKPRSYNLYLQNVCPQPVVSVHLTPALIPHLQITIHGGNGVAIGSLGQYQEDSSAANIIVKDVDVLIHNKDMHNAAYIKTWVGELVPTDDYESDYKPRGGGW